MSRVALGWGLTLVLATGCGSHTPSVAQPRTNTPAARAASGVGAAVTPAGPSGFPVVPMRLDWAGDAGFAFSVELHADGTVRSQGHAIARLEGRALLGSEGNEVWRIADDGTVIVAGRARPIERVRMQADGDLVGHDPDGAVRDVRLGADGTVTETRGVRGTETLGHIEGVTPASRPTAMLLAMLLTMFPRHAEPPVDHWHGVQATSAPSSTGDAGVDAGDAGGARTRAVRAAPSAR